MRKIPKKINCKICKNYLFNKFVVKLKNAPESAQNFSFKKKQTKSRIELNVGQCSGCGLIQITNKPVGYYKKVIRAVGISKPMLNFRKKQFSEFCKKFKLKNKTIIEIGCGTGDYLNVMKKIIKKSHGLESSNKNYKECKKRKLKVFKGFIHNKNYKISKIKYDAFYILSFLEHIPKINEFLRGIYFNLKENAVGIIEVPNFNMILEKKLYTEFIIDHLYYFTKDTLKLALEYNGFEIIRTKEIWHKYINALLCLNCLFQSVCRSRCIILINFYFFFIFFCFRNQLMMRIQTEDKTIAFFFCARECVCFVLFV